MSTNTLNWKKLDFVECGENYSICMEYPYDIRNDKTGKILKQTKYPTGYLYVDLYSNKKRKHYEIHQLIWLAHHGDYNRKTECIDHIDRCRSNNHINNLRLVSRSENGINCTKKKKEMFIYVNELPDKVVINEKQKIYYCKVYDKFFRQISDNQYRDIKERQVSPLRWIIQWTTNRKVYHFDITFFRQQMTQ